MAQVWVVACADADFDTATYTCAQEIWIPQPSIIPELTVEDAQLIGGAVALIWGVAFAFRLVRKALNQIQ